MKIVFIKAVKMIGKPLFFLILAMVVLIGINSIVDGDVIDHLWQRACADQVSQQADNDWLRYANFRKQEFSATSPDQSTMLIEYAMPQTDNYSSSEEGYLNGNVALVVQQADVGEVSEKYLYIGQTILRHPQWLGNDHVYFTSSCGTDCENVYLLNVHSKELRVATINTVTVSSSREQQTTFSDWYGQSFTFPGQVAALRSEIANTQNHLIFTIGNGVRDNYKEITFVFTGQSLVLMRER